MKALTVWQPWASLLVHGAKEYETRSWSTRHRGPLAIHAAKRRPPAVACRNPRIRAALDRAGLTHPRDLRRSAILGVVRVVDVHHVEDRRLFISKEERGLGDWSEGRYAWEVEALEVFEQPRRASGSQKLWNVKLPESKVVG